MCIRDSRKREEKDDRRSSGDRRKRSEEKREPSRSRRNDSSRSDRDRDRKGDRGHGSGKGRAHASSSGCRTHTSSAGYRTLLAGSILVSNLPEAEALAYLPGLVAHPATQVFCVLSGVIAFIQVYKVQEAVGDGASAMIQEVTTGTTRVFSSVFDGIDNTVKVSVFMIGAFLVSMLGSWLQSAAWLCCARRNAASGPHQLAEVAALSLSLIHI